MSEERRIGCHMYDIGIAFYACHECGLKQCGVEMIIFLAFTVTCVFACKHLRSAAVVIVIAVAVFMVEEPRLWTVEMFVVHRNLHLLHLRLQHIKLLSF